MLRTALLLPALLLSAGNGTAQSLAFTDVTVIDVADGVAEPGMTVVVVGERIAAVGEVEDVEVPSDATVINGRGKYLIPGLWDMHVHNIEEGPARSVLLPLFVAHGVTGIREMSGQAFNLQHRAEIDEGTLLGPRMVVGSPLIDGPNPWTGRPPLTNSVVVSDADDALRMVDSLHAQGYAFLKTYNFLSPEAYRALHERGSELGMDVVGHVPMAVSLWEAAELGHRSVEHLMGVELACSRREEELRATYRRRIAELAADTSVRTHMALWNRTEWEPVGSVDPEKCRALYRHLADRQIWVVPTLVIQRLISYPTDPAIQNDPRGRYLPDGWWDPGADADWFDPERRLRPTFDGRLGMLADLHRAGVGILAASDYWGGFVLHDELSLYVQGGLSPLEALRSATLNPARYLGATDSLGTVEPGKMADLVLLDANPLEDIANTTRIRAVVLNGRLFDRAALDALLAAAERESRAHPEWAWSSASDTTVADTVRSVEFIDGARDTVRYVEVVNGRVLGGWSSWQETPDTWGYANDRHEHFSRTERLTLGADGLPLRLEATGDIADGIPWHERFELDGDTARWYTPRERGEIGVTGGAAFYAAVYPAHDVGVLARALLRQPSRTIDLLPEGRARLERIGERVLRREGHSRSVTLYAVHGLDLFPLYVWLDENGATFADDWSVRKGWEGAFPELRMAMDDALADYRRTLARDLVPPARTRPLVIRNARLFDAATATVREDATILIEGDRIAAVGDEHSMEFPPGAEVLDAEGRMVLPGLWDMHAHHIYPADQQPLWSRGFAPLHLAGGVTTARDLGSQVESLVALRDAIQMGEAVGPRILMAGFINGSGGDGILGVRVENAAQARAAVDRYAELGFVQIKTYNLLPADLVHVVIERAKQRGLRVGGHVPFAMTARQAIEAGYDELHHAQMTLLAVPVSANEIIARGESWDTWYQVLAELTPESEPIVELVGLLADSGVALEASLGHFIMEESPPEFIAHAADRFPAPVRRRLQHTVFSHIYVPTSPLARPHWERAVENMFGLVRSAHRAGVPTVVGTDTWPGFGLHHEMELLVRAGIPAPELIALATLGAARVMGMDDELGSVEPGKLADLILVDGEPTADIRDIRRVVTVVKEGRVYDPAAIYRALGIEPCCEQ